MSCLAPTILIGGVVLSVSPAENARVLLRTVSGDGGDPVHDEYNGNIANGNNTRGTRGAGQLPAPTQTTLPPPIAEKPKEENTKPPPALTGTPVVCNAWDGQNYDFVLSPNFKLRNFSVSAVMPHPCTDFNAQYTKEVRCCNLQALAVNVAEPLMAKYGRPNVNSGIRNDNSVSNGLSQHVTGEAADFQFSGWTYNMYWEAAQWVKDNIPYDQFIFEHSSNTGLAWFHLSYRRSGGRAAGDRTKVMTMYRNSYSPGLQRHG